MTKPLCIYHGNCADGFTAAWAVWQKFGDTMDYHPGTYQNPPPDVTGRDVVIVDFSYKYDVLCEMSWRAKSMLILDHHKTAADDLGRLPSVRNETEFRTDVMMLCQTQNMPHIGALFDLSRSGAGIAWDFFHPGVARPPLVNYVEDRDLWRFSLPSSREINALVFSYPYTFENWDHLDHQLSTDDGYLSAAAQGAAIERKHHKDVAELVNVCKRRLRIGGHEVWAASLPYTLTSDAGHLMAAPGEPFAACYWDTAEGRVFSLRSRDGGQDVSEVAKGYGGGGHKNAAGFRVPLAEIGQFEV